jgi:hypothetical protein
MQRMGEAARATLERECRGRGMEALTGSGCRRDLPLLPLAGRRRSVGRARRGGGQRRDDRGIGRSDQGFRGRVWGQIGRGGGGFRGNQTQRPRFSAHSGQGGGRYGGRAPGALMAAGDRGGADGGRRGTRTRVGLGASRAWGGGTVMPVDALTVLLRYSRDFIIYFFIPYSGFPYFFSLYPTTTIKYHFIYYFLFTINFSSTNNY